MIFMNLRTRSSRATGPNTRVPIGSGQYTGQPFPGNVIPANRISPIAQNYMKYYPAPNQAGDAQGRNNYLSENTRSDDFYALNPFSSGLEFGPFRFSQNDLWVVTVGWSLVAISSAVCLS